ncbi:hypothetical protein [Neorhodopirellula lusitana]|uniref:hypothetical protein n=1 Tax=Neorhodopirellula lusitana TaxID=445327 RepID=UPI00384A8091
MKRSIDRGLFGQRKGNSTVSAQFDRAAIDRFVRVRNLNSPVEAAFVDSSIWGCPHPLDAELGDWSKVRLLVQPFS